jgi:peptidoglycan hydrolase-like protein with peptidoglycan-binding domain
MSRSRAGIASVGIPSGSPRDAGAASTAADKRLDHLATRIEATWQEIAVKVTNGRGNQGRCALTVKREAGYLMTVTNRNDDAGGASMKTTMGAVALTAALATGATGAGVIAAIPAAGTVAASNATLLSATVQAQSLRPWPVLRQGPNSVWPKVTVRSLQYLLNAHGARLGVDGAFGPLTRNAVLAFQRAHHLAASGVADAATWRALIITVRKGSTGSAVRAVQDQVNFRNNRNGHTLTVDGIYGPKTQAAVRAFQQGIAFDVHGFPVDGVTGPLTWQALVTEALAG